ncbi:hypothetical protein [Streptomyces wedmorensis]
MSRSVFPTARLDEDAGGSWTPHILLAAEPPEEAQTEALLDLITAQPHFADAIELLTLSAASTDVPARDEWLDGLLGTDDQEGADQAEEDQEDPSDDNEEIGDGEATQPDAGADEDGVPDEYADIEREELETAHQAEADTPTDETDEMPVPPAVHTAEAPDGQAEHDAGGSTIAAPSSPRPLPFLPRQLLSLKPPPC